jgi:signal transduction histidine kinase
MEGNVFILVRASNDGQFRLIATGPPPFTMWSFAPFYLLVLASIGLMSWWLAIGIVPPIRAMAQVAERFGKGDLAARVPAPPNNEIGILATSFNDMAARIETLLQAQRRLLMDVSHELRSPLARLNFSAELARTADDRGGAIDRIQKDLDRLSTLVEEVLEMTRAEGDPVGRRVQPIDLNSLVADVQATCARDADSRGPQIVVSGFVTRPISGDRELLRWGIENVVRNAVRYTPASDVVDVRVTDRPTAAVVTVRDHGPGVPATDLDRIFEPFYRVEESRTSATGGIGLGLAITRRAVAVHRGTVVAENAWPGLRVTIELPYSRELA